LYFGSVIYSMLWHKWNIIRRSYIIPQPFDQSQKHHLCRQERFWPFKLLNKSGDIHNFVQLLYKWLRSPYKYNKYNSLAAFILWFLQKKSCIIFPINNRRNIVLLKLLLKYWFLFNSQHIWMQNQQLRLIWKCNFLFSYSTGRIN